MDPFAMTLFHLSPRLVAVYIKSPLSKQTPTRNNPKLYDR
jgi:hypothetical protein